MRKTLSLKRKLLLAAKYPGTAARLLIDGCKDQLKYHPETASAPNVIVLYVTEMCNLRCPMCAVWQSRDVFGKNSANKKYFTFQEFKDIVRQVEYFKPMFYFIGGEPTLNRDVIKMIAYVHKKGMVTQMTTNGWFLSSLAQPLYESGIDLLSVSLDGPNAQIHDKSRGLTGVFDRATDGIRKLADIKKKHHAVFPGISVNSAVTPWNIDMLEDTIKAVKDLGVDEMSFQNFSFFGKKIQKQNDTYVAVKKTGNIIMGMPVTGATPFNRFQIKKVARFLESLPQLSKKYDMYLYNAHSVKHTEYKEYYAGMYPSSASFCRRPWHILTIRGSGDVEVCQGYVAGNIRKNKIMDVWNNEKYRYFRKIIRKEYFTPACYRCCFLNYSFT